MWTFNLFQDYDPELFGKALPCLIAIGCALPPDYSLSKNYDDEWYGSKTQVQTGPADGPYNPQPINTSSVQLNNDLNTIVQKFSEHYHDAWANRKLENGWVYGEQYSDSQKVHPRLKPYAMLNDYVSILFIFLLLEWIRGKSFLIWWERS